FSSRRRHTRFSRDWSSDVCSSDLNEMRAALKKPWQAQVLGQLITRYESEWFWNKAKWDELDRLLADEGGQENAVWEVEKKRIEKLSWWGELAGKHGVDEEGKAWHSQAVSLVGSCIKVGRINITIE